MRIALLACLLWQAMCMQDARGEMLPPDMEWERISSGHHWKAASLVDDDLVITDVASVSPHARQRVNVVPYDYDTTRDYNSLFKQEKYPALDVPLDALFIIDDDSGYARAGRYRSLVPHGTAITQGWRQDVRMGNKRWRVAAEYQRRKDGKVLAGSMRLKLFDYATGKEQVLVESAGQLVLERQEILWLGDFNADARPELLLKRTWITGEVDYLLTFQDGAGALRVDPDLPYTAFSSGIDGPSYSITRPSGQTHKFPSGKFGVAAFSLGVEAWNAEVEAGRELPLVFADRILMLDAEPLRFTFEHMPTASPGNAAYSNMWGGPVLVRVHYRGQSQVLLQAGSIEDALRIQIDRIDGQPAIRMDYQPHYNNSFIHYWIHDGARFRRLSVQQDQGC